MDADQMEAVHDLIGFARDHAREVFGEKEEFEYGTSNGDAILAAADVVEEYLNADQNEAEDNTLPA